MKIGIDLGGSHIGVGLIEGVELKDTIDVFFTEEDRKDIENAIINHIKRLIKELLEKNNVELENIVSIGIASPGTVANGKVTSWNLGLKEFDLRTKIAEIYNKPVTVRNDGKCAALVEKKYGAMKDYDDCVFVNIGTGLGGAAFLGGKLLEPKKYSGFGLQNLEPSYVVYNSKSLGLRPAQPILLSVATFGKIGFVARITLSAAFLASSTAFMASGFSPVNAFAPWNSSV